MKKLIILLSLITFFGCFQKKEYNIKDLNILQYDSSNNYIKTISEADFFVSTNTLYEIIGSLNQNHKTALFDLREYYMSYFTMPIPNQFGSLWLEFPDLESYYLDMPKYVFVDKTTNNPVTGNIFFEAEDRCEFIFDKKKNIIGFVDDGQMDGKWEIPKQIITLSLTRDPLPIDSSMLASSSIGLITVNYKNGIRHGKTLISDEEDQIYYTCNYFNGQLDGYEELDAVSAECIYNLWTGRGAWELNKYNNWANPCQLNTKQINKYDQGKLVAMKLWEYDFLEIQKCLKDLDYKVNENLNTPLKTTLKNLEEIKLVRKEYAKKFELVEDCIKVDLILDWNNKSKKNLDFLIKKEFIKIINKIN